MTRGASLSKVVMGKDHESQKQISDDGPYTQTELQRSSLGFARTNYNEKHCGC